MVVLVESEPSVRVGTVRDGGGDGVPERRGTPGEARADAEVPAADGATRRQQEPIERPAPQGGRLRIVQLAGEEVRLLGVEGDDVRDLLLAIAERRLQPARVVA